MTKPARQARRPWTPAEDAQLREIYPHVTAMEAAQQLGRTKCSVFQRARILGLGKSQEFFESDLSGRVLRGQTNPAMIGSRFQKGIVPWNKGVKGSCGSHPNSVAAQFKAGSINGNAARLIKPIGAQVIRDGILYQKINNDMPSQNRYRSVHSLVWEADHGPIPPGHKVVFKAGQRTVAPDLITIDRLELVTHTELMHRNSFHNRYPKEVALLIQLKGQLTRKINRKSEALNEK